MDAAHDKLYGRIADLLAQEAQKRNGNLVEFPAEVLQVARQILLAAEKREVYPRISCDTTLIPLLYDTIYNKSHPTKELRSFIWFHLNRLLKAGNTDWLKSYWEWASQYYRQCVTMEATMKLSGMSFMKCTYFCSYGIAQWEQGTHGAYYVLSRYTSRPATLAVVPNKRNNSNPFGF